MKMELFLESARSCTSTLLLLVLVIVKVPVSKAIIKVQSSIIIMEVSKFRFLTVSKARQAIYKQVDKTELSTVSYEVIFS